MNEDLISRSALSEKLQAHHDFFVNGWGGFSNLPTKDKVRVDEITNCIAEVMNAPAVDAVIPVRCKDCEHYINAHDDGLMYCMRPIFPEDYNETGYIFPLEVPMRETDFCSYGKRRTSHETMER